MNGGCSFQPINLINDDPFDYLSNGTSSQIEQTKKTSLIKMAIGFLVKLNIYSSWTNKNDILCTLEEKP